MKNFDDLNTPKALLTPDIVAMLTSIHEHKGKQGLFVEAHADLLTNLMEIAKIQSTGASNRIEGINTTDKRLEELVRDKSAPKNRSEQEIAGYRDVLATIHESYDYIYPRPNIILQLHKQLYSFSRSGVGGSYKNSDNFITQTDAEGKQSVRFQPVAAYLTPDAMDRLCAAFVESLDTDEYDALLLIPMFILDFLCIHPFNDGNGRMSRLLTLLLFYRAGYIVGKYISLEKLIENSKDSYYEALYDSSAAWHENANDYLPFIRYYLGILQKAYGEFEDRVKILSQRGLSKHERVKAIIDNKLGKITKAEILAAVPDISQVTVERTLAALVKSAHLVKIGAGRTTAYVKTDTPQKVQGG
ncbi:cell division protein Fic [Betaproteobacteria bacterium]|nr:cell division protein Fic [Betaproteobacteria bacterium]GHU46163.1 cell division protein Fic [Betaproteobacteria bacterium]